MKNFPAHLIERNGFCGVVGCDEPEVVNALTSVATVFSFAQFLDSHFRLSDENPCGLKIAYGMMRQLVQPNGTVTQTLSQSPNGLETNSWQLFNSLANLLLGCRSNPEIETQLLSLTGSCCCLHGILSMAQDPFLAVPEIYALILQSPTVYSPVLREQPNQWTLTLKFNSSGAVNFLPAGPGFLAFDKNDRVWINNNTTQGSPNSSNFAVVLEPNGTPAPFSPLWGGGLLGSGFGAAASPDREIIALGNFGWGPQEYNPLEGSVSRFCYQGCSLSPPGGDVEKTHRIQGLIYDSRGNLWMTSWGSQQPLGFPGDSIFQFPNSPSAVTVYRGGNPERASRVQFDSPFHGTFDIATRDDIGYVSNAGSSSEVSSVVKMQYRGGVLVELQRWKAPGNWVFRQVRVFEDRVYVAAVARDAVLIFSLDLDPLGEIPGFDGPWGITFDSTGTLFGANFLRDEAFSGNFGVTLYRDGVARLMTLPSGGEPVTLANGQPLFGTNGPPSFEPLMRQTGTGIDRAGNLWTLNNWKPVLMQDFQGNPGGDGVVVFLGVAAPRED